VINTFSKQGHIGGERDFT